MRFLLDQCLSPSLSNLLSAAGHDALHARDVGLSYSGDSDLLAWADAERRVVITADTDFPRILTLGARRGPSCILFRGDFAPDAAAQAHRILATLPSIESHLERGAIVVISKLNVRIRKLPVTPE